MKTTTLKLLLICGVSGASLFALATLVFDFGNWVHLLIMCWFGFFVGLLAAAELAPKEIQQAWLVQLICGTIAGWLLGIVISQPIENQIAMAIIGGFLGWLTPCWIKYIQIP